MKLFKNLTLYFSCILFFGPIEIFAAEETKYIASMSGVECTACKKTIAKAIAKLNGVKTIRIVKEGKKNHRLEVLTDGSHELAKADIVKALEKAKHYKILGWMKDQP
ncbi:heavy-metal-associated domain-containing protein [Verrucomicrobiales bacterium]|nr:heavy-metal-associated domain-containing protein [Verrucomicrobiales bacterium]